MPGPYEIGRLSFSDAAKKVCPFPCGSLETY